MPEAKDGKIAEMADVFERPRVLDFTPPRGAKEVGLQMAPLIDIVFLLICFYLLVAQLIKSQKDPAVELPVMAHAVAPVEMPAEVVVNLRADGSITVNGRPVALAALPGLLRGQLAVAMGAGQPFRAVVRADRRQRYARLDEVLRVCREAGLSKVIFRAKEPDRP